MEFVARDTRDCESFPLQAGFMPISTFHSILTERFKMKNVTFLSAVSFEASVTKIYNKTHTQFATIRIRLNATRVLYIK